MRVGELDKRRLAGADVYALYMWGMLALSVALIGVGVIFSLG
jgi:hypothetical protein